MKATCPSCGATAPPGAARCDLCGSSLDETADPMGAAAAPEPAAIPEAAPAPVAPPKAAALTGGPMRCPACGHVNPPWSRFCNQCASPLAESTEAAAPPPAPPVADAAAPPPAPPGPAPAEARSNERPPSDPGRRALIYVGAGLAAVVLLWFLTQRSAQAPSPAPTAGAPTAGAEAPSLTTAAPVALPDSLQAQIEVLERSGSAASFNDAGGVLYRAAAALPPDDPQRPALAQQAVDFYDRSLALEDDPDVRVNLAVAALLDPRNPMRAVQELQAVLEADPDHVEGNFNMGLLRMQIGRLDGAAESFRRVIELTEPGDPLHRRAQQALSAVEEALTEQNPTGSPSG